MRRFTKGRSIALTCALGAGLAGLAQAGEVLVNTDIIIDTTWVKTNTYNLQQQIYVRNGATLTIEAGTIIASDTNIGGSLAITRGSQILALGTAAEPGPQTDVYSVGVMQHQLLTAEADDQVTQCGQIIGSMSGADGGAILAESDITHIVTGRPTVPRTLRCGSDRPPFSISRTFMRRGVTCSRRLSKPVVMSRHERLLPAPGPALTAPDPWRLAALVGGRDRGSVPPCRLATRSP